MLRCDFAGKRPNAVLVRRINDFVRGLHGRRCGASYFRLDNGRLRPEGRGINCQCLIVQLRGDGIRLGIEIEIKGTGMTVW